MRGLRLIGAGVVLAALVVLAVRVDKTGAALREDKAQTAGRLAALVTALWPVRVEELANQGTRLDSWPDADRQAVWMRAMAAVGRQFLVDPGQDGSAAGAAQGHGAGGKTEPRAADMADGAQCDLNRRTGLAWPANGRLVAGFEQGREARQGIALATADGETVRAAADGRVVYSGVLRGLGRTVIVAHGLHCHTVYACLAEATVAGGESVARGGALGRAGFCPPTGGRGVYFELRFQEKALNPAEWFVANPLSEVSGER